MLAFAILGLVLASTYALSVRSTRQQLMAMQQYEDASMARALLEEYVITYPQMPSSGVYLEKWGWKISETPQDVLKPSQTDRYFEFVKVTAHIFRDEQQAFEASTVVARRAK